MATNKEAHIESLSEAEIECINEIVIPEYYADLNVDDIRSKLFRQLFKHERESVNEISEIDESVRDLMQNLDSLDNQFKELETILDNQTNEYLSVINDLSNFESQSKIVDTRTQNYVHLKETLQMLIGETEFSRDEISLLLEPNFEEAQSLKDSIAMLKKIGKYIRNSNRFHENQFIVSKNQEFSKYVAVFESKLREYMKKLSKKALKFYSEKQNKEELSIVETGFFRKNVVGLKEIFQQLYLINDSSEGYFRGIVKDVRLVITEFTNVNLEPFEKRWKELLQTFNIFKKKWNITSEMEITQESLNENQSKTLKLTAFLEKTISNLDEQMEKDETFWTKFFSFEDRKLARGNSEITLLMTSIYTLPKQKLIELLKESKRLSSLSTFFIMAELKKIIELKKAEEEENENKKGKEGTSFSFSIITEIFTELNIQSNTFALEQKKLLDTYKVDQIRSEVLLPVRNFTSLSIALYKIFAETNKEIFLLNVREIYESISAWIQKMSQTFPKNKDTIMIENNYYIYNKFSKIQDQAYTLIAEDTKRMFESQSKVYVKTIFTKAFGGFVDVWFKLKEISEQTDITTVPLSGPYSKTSFLKSVKSTFSGISTGIDKIINKMSKEFSKEGGLLRVEYDRFTEYMLKEYEDIENFANKAYKERINPSKAEIQAVLLDKRP